MKAKALHYALDLLAIASAFLAPVRGYMGAIGFLVAADFVAGTWASLKHGQQIQSRRMRETITKSLAYELAIVVGFVLDGIVGLPDAMIARVVAGFIGLTEAKSIFENLGNITGIDFWAALMDKLKPRLNADKLEQSRTTGGEPPPESP